MKYMWRFTYAFGSVAVEEEDGAIVLVNVGGGLPPDAQECLTELLKQAGTQLSEYFAGKRKDFTLPLAPKGTDFQKKVWEALRGIPYGETRTYGQIAVRVGIPRASRAVGMANHCNPIGILIPCHRVIGADGKLVGYAAGLETKKRLLELERANRPKE